MPGSPLVKVAARVEYVPGLTAFDGTLETGEGVTFVVGPNGAGKTTLLHVIAGALPPSSVKGDVRVLGANPFKEVWVKRYIALARQEPTTFSWNYPLKTALRLYAVLKGEDPSAAEEVLDELGLPPQRRVGELSFGMKRKLEVAKLMLSRSARVFLLDELIDLDQPTVAKVVDFLRAKAEEGACVVVVTHEPRHLQLLSGRVVVLKSGKVLRIIESRRELDDFLKTTLYEITILAEGGDPAVLTGVGGVVRVVVEGEGFKTIRVKCSAATINDVVLALISSGARIRKVEYDEITPLFEE